MNKLVTVGMPVFNDEKFLRKALDSLLAQTVDDFELIISDDGSTDGSQQICEQYASKDERIRYIRQQRNIGISRNMQFLLDQGSGEYFMWAGDDDFWHPTFIQSLLEAHASSPNVVSAMTPSVFVDETDEVIPAMPVQTSDYSGPNPYLRLTKLIRTFDDSFGYGLFRRQRIAEVKFPIWWFVNKSSPANNIYPTLCFYLAKGDFALVGTKPKLFKRVKQQQAFNYSIPYSHAFLRGYLAFLLRKLNLVSASLGQIGNAGHPWLAVAIAPKMIGRWLLASALKELLNSGGKLLRHEIKFF